jgi:hypothetical protein
MGYRCALRRVRAVVAMGLIAVAGCGGGEPAPDGYERWSGGGATFVYPEAWEEQDRPAGVKFVAGSESARVIVLEETGQDIYAFMSDALGDPEWLNHRLRLGPRERIDVPGAERAYRREATAGGAFWTFVFASRTPRNHFALAVATTRDLDEEAIVDSFALD